MTGKYIIFEGGEGCGKSTQVELLKNYLENKGYEVVTTREPGGTKEGEAVRAVLKDENHDLDSKEEFLLFTTSRAFLRRKIIEPALKQGKIVISDRSWYSSLAYQGYAGNLDIDFIKHVSTTTMGDKSTPHLGLIIDVHPKKGLEKKKEEKGEEGDRFHKKALEYHEKVNESYLKIAKEYGFKVISYKEGDVKGMHEQIVKHVEEILCQQ